MTFGPLPMTRSVFQVLTDTDVDHCLALIQALFHQLAPFKSYAELQQESASGDYAS